MHLDILVSLIVTHHFQNERCLLILTNNEVPFSYNSIGAPFAILRNESGIFQYELLFSYHGCQGIIIHSKEPWTVFDQIEKQIRLHWDRFNRRKYLILWTKNEKENVIERFGKHLNYVADLLVVVFEGAVRKSGPKKGPRLSESESEEIYSLYTHRYVGNENCNAPVLIRKWVPNSSDFSFLDDLYPDKLKNQMGRKLKIAT